MARAKGAMRELHVLSAGGGVPNNTELALVLCPRVIDPAPGPRGILAMLAANGWGGGWIDGIYPFHHYHATSHEVLVIVRGKVSVAFGGPAVLLERELSAGDGVVIPAGVGHCRLAATADLSVVGAYPPGQEDWDLQRVDSLTPEAAARLVAGVALPPTDPFSGAADPLLADWRAAQG